MKRQVQLALFVVIGLLIAANLLAQDTLTVMSYNIKHAAGMDTIVNINRIADVINKIHPDLVALQEVDNGVTRSYRTDEPTALADLTSTYSLFSQNIPFQGGQYGNAVLARDSIRVWKNVHLPSLYSGEQRGVLVAAIPGDVAPITFLATHLDYREANAERLLSLAVIDSLANASTNPFVIVAGDFNDTPESEVIAKMRKNFRSANQCSEQDTVLTFPADFPDRQIDYIFYRARNGYSIQCLSFQVLNEPIASDHRPIVAKLVLWKNGTANEHESKHE